MWKNIERPLQIDSQPLSSAWFTEAASYLRKSLRRLGVAPADLEDAVQEALIAIHRKRDTFDATRPLKPWLFGFAVRVAANQRRKRRHEQPSEDDVVASDAPSPERQALFKEARSIAQQALHRMPSERSIVFSLHELEGLSAAEIGELVAAPTNTIYSRLRTARAEFAQVVNDLITPRHERGGLESRLAAVTAT